RRLGLACARRRARRHAYARSSGGNALRTRPGRSAAVTHMNARIKRLGLSLLVAYGVLILAATYWQVVRADELANDPETNARRMLAEEERITRGRILDRDGVVL